jgi:hypothetical protein
MKMPRLWWEPRGELQRQVILVVVDLAACLCFSNGKKTCLGRLSCPDSDNTHELRSMDRWSA